MCPAQKQDITEELLSKYLQDESHSKEMAHFFIETLGPEGKKWLAERLLPPGTRTLKKGNTEFSKCIGARELDPEKQRLLEVSSLFNYFSHRKKLLANSLTAQEAAELLSLTKQAIHDRVRAGKLVGLLENNALRLPTFQFDPAGPNGVVAGLPEVMAEINSGIFGKISWMTEANVVFAGRAPIDVLREGKAGEVLREARSVGVA